MPGGELRHEWYVVELRTLAETIRGLAGATAYTTAALERVFELLEEGPDCAECLDELLDGGREVDDFPERLDEEHVIRILALEDAVLVRHGLEQWLVALAARRGRRIEEELAQARAREHGAAQVPF